MIQFCAVVFAGGALSMQIRTLTATVKEISLRLREVELTIARVDKSPRVCSPPPQG